MDVPRSPNPLRKVAPLAAHSSPSHGFIGDTVPEGARDATADTDEHEAIDDDDTGEYAVTEAELREYEDAALREARLAQGREDLQKLLATPRPYSQPFGVDFPTKNSLEPKALTRGNLDYVIVTCRGCGERNVYLFYFGAPSPDAQDYCERCLEEVTAARASRRVEFGVLAVAVLAAICLGFVVAAAVHGAVGLLR